VTGPATEIVCVECGGTAHLIQALDPEAPPEAGDVLVYRCSECWERWDIVVDEEDVERDD
jgi:DNA-directed RNA polymerase subunit RPC12/RpoP